MKLTAYTCILPWRRGEEGHTLARSLQWCRNDKQTPEITNVHSFPQGLYFKLNVLIVDCLLIFDLFISASCRGQMIPLLRILYQYIYTGLKNVDFNFKSPKLFYTCFFLGFFLAISSFHMIFQHLWYLRCLCWSLFHLKGKERWKGNSWKVIYFLVPVIQ